MNNSIIIRYGLIMAVIIALSMMGMISSVLIAESLENDAARINLAGSLRMQSYKISQALILKNNNEVASSLGDIDEQIKGFEEKLNNPMLSLLIHYSSSNPLKEDYTVIQTQWQIIKSHATQSLSAKQITQLQKEIDGFVDKIDHLVLSLQIGSEHKIRLLRIVQGVILFSTLITGFFALYNLSSNVVEPLRRMVSVSNRIKKGEFDGRIHYEGNDELGVLAKSINLMAASLSELYDNLETRVAEKTAILRNTNNALANLYQASLSLPKDARNAQNIQLILGKLEHDLGKDIKLSICISNTEAHDAFQIAPKDNIQKKVHCFASNCDECRALSTPETHETKIFYIRREDEEYGELFAEYPKDQPLKDWQKFIIRNLAEILAASFSLSKKKEQDHYLALMEERAVIARELHDSLAQSLSYLKMQTTRLEKLKQKDSSEALQADTIRDIREGLNDAYRQLRELLTTFRLEIKDPGLKAALQGTVAEFSEKAHVAINLDFKLEHVPLTPNEEIHTLQIVREALSNINRHAQANTANVEAFQRSDNKISVRIVDDGIGLQEAGPGSHYGTKIMQERADSLDGQVSIFSNKTRGVTVELTYTPAFLNKHGKENKVENYEPLRYIKNPTH